MQVGYIGLGSMGGALARRLVREHPILVWDVNSAAVAELTKLGATAASCLADLARRCDVVVMCLPRSSDVSEAIFGTAGLHEGLTEGKVIVDQTSGDPAATADMARTLALRGVTMLDAPVSGGPAGAEAGTIAIMVSGPTSAYDKIRPILTSISPNVDFCGDRVGNAHALKLINNTMSAGCRLATLEIVSMGKKMGLSLETMIDVINKGSGRNKTSKVMLPALLEGKPSAGNFAMSLMLKDLNLATELGMKCGAPMLIGNIVRALLQIGVNTLGETARLEDTVHLIESMAGTRIANEQPRHHNG